MTMALVLVSLEFEDQILQLAQQVADIFGFLGLCLLVFIGDSIPSPIPPDLVLVVIMKSHLQQNWPLWVGLIALTSMCAGHCGYWMGHFIAKASWLPDRMKTWSSRYESIVVKFGPWAVLLAAITPFPFSFTCISAGFLKLPYGAFSWAAAARAPRIFLFYLLFSSSSFFRDLWFA